MKTKRTNYFLIATLAALAAISACGSSDDGINFPTPPDITDTWQGSFTDNRGSGQLLLVVSDQGRSIMPANVSGTLTMTYADGSIEHGDLADGSSLYKNVDGEFITFLMVLFETEGHGANLFQGTLSTDLNTLSGSFGGDWSQGSFELTRS